MKRATWLLFAVLCLGLFVQWPQLANAQTSPCSNGYIGVLVLYRIAVCGATSAPNAYAVLAAPTITPEPLLAAPVTSQMTMADQYVDSVAVDTNITQGFGYAITQHYLCGNFYGISTCFRHIRDGLMSGNGSTYDADLNALAANSGIDNAYLVNTNDNNTGIQSGLSEFIAIAAVLPPNEPDADNFAQWLRYNISSGAGYIPVNYNTLLVPGVQAFLGEGPTQETIYVGPYAYGQNGCSAECFQVVTSGGSAATIANAHTVAETTLTASASGNATPSSILNNYTYGQPVQTYPPIPPTPTPLPTATAYTITVASATGIVAGDYMTLPCRSDASNIETIQVSPSYTSGTTIPLVAPPYYAHNSGEVVAKSCIRRTTTSNAAIANDMVIKQNQIAAALSGSGAVIADVPMAAAGSMNGFLASYGGTPQTYANFAIAQGHDYPGTSPGGEGAGITGTGNSHQECFGFNSNYGSWQYQLCANWAEGGTLKPNWCTECSWPMVPVGAAYGTTYGSSGQIPDDIAAAWEPRLDAFLQGHKYNRVYHYNLIDGSGGFCTYGLVRSPSCGVLGTGNSSYAAKAAYYGVTDRIGLYTDASCKYPACTFTPNTLTWGWATSPTSVRSAEREFSNGNVAIDFWYENQDYNVSNPGSCNTTTACYQWGGVGGNTTVGSFTYSDTLYVQGAHLWSSCTLIDQDLNSSDGAFGHFLPTATATFSPSDQLAVTFKPEIQTLLCTGTGFSPTKNGSPTPFPTVQPTFPATPEPTLTPWAAPTPVPTRT